MMKWAAVGVVVALGLLVAVVLVAGARAPKRHVARVWLTLKQPPQAVWAVVADLSAWPSWNTAVSKMARLPDKDGHPLWALHGKRDSLPSEVLEARPPTAASAARLVTRIADEGLPFGGTWTWDLEGDGAGTRVTITEDGVIKSAVFRGVSSLFLGYTHTQRGSLRRWRGRRPTG